MALNEPRELRRTMMSAKLRYQREVGSASRLFTNLDGQESSDLPIFSGKINIKESWRLSGNTGTQWKPTLKRLEWSVDDLPVDALVRIPKLPNPIVTIFASSSCIPELPLSRA